MPRSFYTLHLKEGDRVGAVFGSDGRWDNWASGVELFGKPVRPLSEDELIALELDVERLRPSATARQLAG